LELGGEEAGKSAEAEKPKKRVIKNPQPKLDPDRILGPRGVPILEDVFSDFKPRGYIPICETVKKYSLLI
jgi:hypothetical protein